MESTGGDRELIKGGLVSEEMGKTFREGMQAQSKVFFPGELTENQPGKEPSNPHSGLQLVHLARDALPPAPPRASTKLPWPGQWVIG